MEKAVRVICGAKNRQGQPCQHEAGWGTAHLGQGKCKLHGGNGGRISRYNRIKGELAERMQKHETDPDPANLLPELCLLRALLEGWMEKNNENETAAIPGAVTLTGNIRKIVDTIHKMQTRELLTSREYEVALAELTRIIVEEVKDVDTVRRIGDRFRAAFAYERAVTAAAVLGDGDEAED
jgi:hypothetical protein